MRFYSSYKDAHDALGIPGSWQRGTIGSPETGITSIKLTANPKSYDKISRDMQTIYYVGRGKKASPGQPVSFQQKKDQLPFYKSLATGNPVHVMMKLKPGFVAYLGTYKVVSVRLVPAFYEYYQITLTSIHNAQDKSDRKDNQ